MSAAIDNTSTPPVAVNGVHPVDEKLPIFRLFLLGLQHVTAMYAGAIAVPLIVGGAMVEAGKIQPSDVVHLIVAGLFVSGIASIIGSIGVWRFGARLPLIMGVSFAALSPMVAIGSEYGITAIYGSVISCGIMMLLIAPIFARVVKYFPAIVTGTIMTVIGLSLMKVPAGWIVSQNLPENILGGWNYILALISLVTVVIIHRFAPAAWKSVAVLGGIVVGTIFGQFIGANNWTNVKEAAWVGVPKPFMFGLPTFEVSAIITMCIVGLVIMTETAADIVAVGNIAGRKVDRRTLADGLRADGLATLAGGVFNTFPHSAFAQNVGLVSLTRAFSRYIVTAAGVILLCLGLLPKLGGVVAAIPTPVLGGAGVALFGMVAFSGIRTLATVEWTELRGLIVGVSLAIAMLPSVSQGFYSGIPTEISMILSSGIAAGSISIILLNLIFNRANNGHLDLSIEESTAAAESK